MEKPLRTLLQSAGMLDGKEAEATEKPCTPGKRVIWYFQHGDFRKDNPDGLAMEELELPLIPSYEQIFPA
jgi:hypothetical protein